MRATAAASFFIGWDVGGWNCDKNSKSRDAIVILDSSRYLVGTPWRGNLRRDINSASSTGEWLEALFKRCGANYPGTDARYTMAIDTPLGFSTEFVDLITNNRAVPVLGDSETNPYLYRYTERFMFQSKNPPLSPIKDMIGSQATKGMHVLAKFATVNMSCGIWSDGGSFWAIEAYPSACREHPRIVDLIGGRDLGNSDINDAMICAMVAYLFENERDLLEPPPADVPKDEGWIWVPKLSPEE
jgi:hypothetical protein